MLQQCYVMEGTRVYQAWHSTMPLTTELYFFNLLNAEEFLRNHSKPILEERGPYTFRYSSHHYKGRIQKMIDGLMD